MSPFDNDPFESILREFFGGRRASSSEDIIQGEEEERNIDFIENKDKVFLIFELPGYSQGDITVSLNGNNIKIIAKRKPVEDEDNYISQKLSNGVNFNKMLPKFVKTKNYSKTFRNGVLEIGFDKK